MGGTADTQVNEWSGGEERKGVCVCERERKMNERKKEIKREGEEGRGAQE